MTAAFEWTDVDSCSSFQCKAPCPMERPGNSLQNKWLLVAVLSDAGFIGKVFIFFFHLHDSESDFGKSSVVLSVPWGWSPGLGVVTRWGEIFGGCCISFLRSTVSVWVWCVCLYPPSAPPPQLHPYQWIQMNLGGGTHVNPASGLTQTWTSLVSAPSSQGRHGVSKMTW